MPVTATDRKVTQFPLVAAAPNFYVPAVDTTLPDPADQNVRVLISSILSLVDLSSVVPTSRQVTGSASLAGGGDLTTDRTFSLVNDLVSPGPSMFYGTNGGGVKGWQSFPTGIGTVTSFSSGNLAPLFTTVVATATTTPAQAFSLNTQAANTVFAGPTGGGAAVPTFRALTATDIPNLSAVYQPFDAGLTSLANAAATNAFYYLSAPDTWSTVTVGSGLSFTGGTLSATGGSSGDVNGPASSTDNAIARFDGTTGKLIQNSAAIIDDNGRLLLTVAGTGVVLGFNVVAPTADYIQYNVGKDSTHYFTAEWDSVLNNGNISTYGLNYPIRIRASQIELSTGVLDTNRLVINGAGAIRFNAYGAGILTTDSSGNITASATIPSTSVSVDRITGSTYSTNQDFINTMHSPGLISGGGVTVSSGTQVTVAAGNGMVRIADDDISSLQFFNWNAATFTVPNDDQVRYFGVVYNGGSPVVEMRTAENWNNDTEIPLGSALRGSSAGFFALSNPFKVGDPITNIIQRFDANAPVLRDAYVGGLMISEVGTRNIAISAGKLWHRLNDNSFAAFDSSGASRFTTVYYNGTNWVYTPLVAQWPNAQYNNIATGLVTMNNNRFANLWFYIGATGNNVFMVYGQAEYNQLADAFAEPEPGFFPTNTRPFVVLVGKLTFRKNDALAMQLQSPFTAGQLGFGSVNTHNDLSGLQGGVINEYYHLTATQHAAATRNATALQSGLLTAADWTTFNNKEPALGNPAADGYVLSSTTAGVRSWIPPGSGGGGVPSITGTANQVLVNGTAGVPQTAAATLTLPQNIHTAATPTFAGLTSPIGLSTRNAGAFTSVLVDSGTGALPTPLPGVSNNITLATTDSLSVSIESLGFNSTGLNLTGRSIGGTRAAPSATPDAQILVNLRSFGFGTAYTTSPSANYQTLADGLWSGTNNGSYHVWQGTPNASTTRAEWMRLYRGNLLVGTTSDSSLSGAGNINTAGAVHIQNSNILGLHGAAGTERQFMTFTGNVFRWSTSTNTEAETGSNAGSNYTINAFNDAGVYTFSPVHITRSNGSVQMTGGVNNTPIGNLTQSTGRFTSITGLAPTAGQHDFATAGTGGHIQVYGGTHGTFPAQVRIDASFVAFNTASGTSIGSIGSTGLNSMAIGASSPSTGVFTTINVPKIINLTGNGFVKTSGGDGTLSIDTNTYLTTATAASTYQPLDGDLTAIAALSGTNTIYYRSAANTWTAVTIGTNLTFTGGTLSASGGGAVASVTGTANEITASPTTGAVVVSLPSALTFTGKTVTGGTFNSGAFNGTIGATTPSTGVFTLVTQGTSSNGIIRNSFRNTSNGSSAYSILDVGNDTSPTIFEIVVNSSTNTASGGANSTFLTTGGAYNFSLGISFNPLITMTSGGVLTFPSGGNGAIGNTTPNTGAFTTLSANDIIKSSGTASAGFSVGKRTSPFSDAWTIFSQTGELGFFNHSTTTVPVTFTETGINSTAIGATTPSTGQFTSLASSGRIVLRTVPDNEFFGITTPAGAGRWSWYPSSTESGGNSGSDFTLTRYSDAGSSIGPAMLISRATGSASFTSINNTPIGATTPSTAAFTNLLASGTVRFSSLTSGTLVVDGSGNLSVSTSVGGGDRHYFLTAPVYIGDSSSAGGPDAIDLTAQIAAAGLNAAGITVKAAMVRVSVKLGPLSGSYTANAGTFVWGDTTNVEMGATAFVLVTVSGTSASAIDVSYGIVPIFTPNTIYWKRNVAVDTSGEEHKVALMGFIYTQT